MKTLLLTPLLMTLAGCTAAPLAPLPVWEGTPPAETLTLKPGQDPRGTINKQTHRADVRPGSRAGQCRNPRTTMCGRSCRICETR